MKNFKKGMLFTSIGTYSNFLVQLIVNMILSRILTPKDYGVVAIMQVFIVFFNLMIESGMGPAIIQNKNLIKTDYKNLFSFSAIFSIILAISFGFFGNILALIYNNDVYKILTWIEAISILFNGLNIVPTAILNKRMQFKAVNFSLVFSNIFSAIIGITTAFLGFGVYALIYSAITSSLINFLLNRFFTQLTFSKKIKKDSIIEIWNFSKNQFGFNFINYFSRNSDNILIGKFMGATPLANYNKAYQLLMLPNQLFLGVINPVLQPVLSDYQDDVEYIKNFYYKVVHLLGLIGIPLSIFLSMSSKQIILFMFGNQWGEAVLPFSILALTVWCQLTVSTTGAIFQARNQANVLFFTGFISALILVTSIIIGIISKTIFGVAISLSIGFFIAFFWNFSQLIIGSLHSSFLEFLSIFRSAVVLGGLTFIALYLESFFDPNNYFISLAIRSIIFLSVMICYIILTDEKNQIKILLKK
ncbi:lipopolysaccharide biosynthesis protein [Lactococcus lactis]|uniref:Lipopolysaccharide biosynthesis protein n=1 Tax=Lactococcus lactis TaxID=1358 RepID=A0AAW8UIH8_9LACT|nr:lipopolysaccharide biosynthesis protein [Lactococcus lactis]MDT2882285.1 lipopolysaccharide biosynthesis protein [Lactococcus lactis]MDT2909874.1 lipopolysaccharide biosynthesis protein [Lactococcus lactis]MDT2946740.1 lipopolysaccharide biosynthesis protein [Lactococcus lactis]